MELVQSGFYIHTPGLWRSAFSGGHIIFDAEPATGTFYILLILAALGLKGSIINRNITANFLVDSLAFALRNPERRNYFGYNKGFQYCMPISNLNTTGQSVNIDFAPTQ